MSRVWFLSAAFAELKSARDWYDAQRPGLGDEFIDAVDAAVTLILDFPDAYPLFHRDARRVLLERFPYGMYYRAEGTGIVIVACLHVARDPRALRHRSGGG